MDTFGKPDLLTAKRILAVQPHYEDNDIAAGGILRSQVDAGVELVYLTVMNDLIGWLDTTLKDEDAAVQLRIKRGLSPQLAAQQQ